jgi:proteasome activator-like protein
MSEQDQRIVVIGPDGSTVATPDSDSSEQENTSRSIAGMVSQPDKVMRIGTMIKQLLEEVKAAPLDEASRNRLRDVHASSIRELEEGLAPELREELDRLTLPFGENETPSDAELRIAQAQLVGWLEGLFHGIQTALFAQQMAARAQLEEMRRRALPGGLGAADGMAGPHEGEIMPGPGRGPSSGPYL